MRAALKNEEDAPVSVVFALLVAVLSVLVGALLGAVPRARAAVGPVKSFALVASLVVVFGKLLPSAIAGVGWAAALAFVATLVAMSLPDRLAERDGADSAAQRPAARWGIELGFAGLVIHTIGDGVGLGAYGGGTGTDRIDVVIAIAGHTVPLVAAFVIAFAEIEGRRRAFLRAGALALAAAAGVGLTSAIGGDLLHVAEPWINAVVAALLLHVVAHTVHGEPPRGVSARALELAALALGLGLLAIGDHTHDEGARHHVAEVVGELLLRASPAVVIAGLVVAAAGSRSSAGQGRFGRWMASPWRRELGPTTTLLAASFLGFPFALWRWITGVALATAAGRGAREDVPKRPGFREALGDYAGHVAPRALVGLLAAAYAEVFIAHGSAGTSGVDLLAAAALAAVPWASAIVGVPTVAVLVGKGWSVAAAFAALGLASVVQSEWARQAYQKGRAGAIVVASIVTLIVACASGLAFDAVAAPVGPVRLPFAVEIVATAIVAAAVLWVVYTHGVMGWIRLLLAPADAAAQHRHGRRA